ncbi:MAG: ATP-grasp domain-containing protein [Bacteroides caccae]|nr:ATP-grasp domain-containing protein [Bacteroides caccae]
MYIKNMKDITILFSACSSPSAPGMFHFLKNVEERNIRIVGVDMQEEPSVYYMVDAFYQVPAASDPDYVDIVLDICKKENVIIYFPNISAEVEAVVNRKAEFDAVGVKLSVSNLDSILISNNKLKTYQMLQDAGIDVPKFYRVHSVEDFIEGCKYMDYPNKAICLKIVSGSGSRGVRLIDSTKSRYQIFAKEKPNSFYTSYEEMLSILKEPKQLDEMMLVEFMPGNEYTVDLLAEKGKVLYQVGRENVVSLMSIAQESILVYDENAYKISKQVVELLNVDGNMGFDFMRDENGRAVLMDINPRITATVSVIAAGGVNLIYLRIKQLLGEELPECEPVYGTRLKRRYSEYYTAPDGSRIE